MLFNGEREAIQGAIKSAEKFGYGNLIDRLRMAWVLKLLKDYPDWGIKQCCSGALMTDQTRINQCVKIHRQDLIDGLKEYTCEVLITRECPTCGKKNTDNWFIYKEGNGVCVECWRSYHSSLTENEFKEEPC